MKYLKPLLLILLPLLLVTSISAAGVTFSIDGEKLSMDADTQNQLSYIDLFENFKNVMPGDTRTQTITIKNGTNMGDYIQVYLRAVPHGDENAPVTRADIDTMNAGLQQLKLTVTQGEGEDEITLFSPEKADGLTEYVLLGQIPKKESVTLNLTLEVPLTLGNEYANAIGEVDWDFKVEWFEEIKEESPLPTGRWITVRKVWDDGDSPDRPDAVTVILWCDGKEFDRVDLSERHIWAHTWAGLDPRCDWEVEEIVPEGYDASYKTIGHITTITNSLAADVKPVEPEVPETDAPETETPKTEVPEMEAPETNAAEQDVLADSNALNAVAEPVTAPAEPVPDAEQSTCSLTVVKVWDADGERQPDSVSIQLWNGETPVEEVILGDWNNWTFTWTSLDTNGNWSVVEANIPNGYVPVYEKDGDVVTIINVAALLQTGQNDWLIPVLSGVGLLVIGAGLYLVLGRKRKNDHA